MFSFKRLAALCLITLFIVKTQAELFIVKEKEGEVVPLDANDWDNYTKKDGIFDILQKYQWPMNAVSDLTKEEREALFAETPYAERNFIAKKIQKAFPNDCYKVGFVPTVVYELLAIWMMHEKPFGEWKNIRSKVFNEQDFAVVCEKYKKYFTLVCEKYKKDFGFKSITSADINELVNLAVMIGQNGAGFPGFQDMASVMDILLENEKKLDIKLLRSRIYALYTDVNNHEESKKVHFLLNWFVGIKTPKNTNFYDLAESAIKMIDSLSYDWNKNANSANPNAIVVSGADFLEIDYPLPIFKIKESEFISDHLKPEGIVARTIDIELLTQQKNAGLIFRGTDLIEMVVGTTFDTKQLIASSLYNLSDIKSFKDVGSDYKSDYHPYSMSFGVSIFAGFFWDRGMYGNGANVYSFMREFQNYGYALTINKRGYRASLKLDIDDLFFIPPLNTLSGLFAHGVFFHPRIKACSKDPEVTESFDRTVFGFGSFRLPDHSHLFVVKRDAFKHQQLVSQFVADNLFLIKKGCEDLLLPEERMAILKNNQKEAANFYGAIPKLSRAVKKLEKKVKEKGKVVVKQEIAKGYKKYKESVLEKSEKSEQKQQSIPAIPLENKDKEIIKKACVVEFI